MARVGGTVLLAGVLILLLIGAAQGTDINPGWEKSIPGISCFDLSEDGSVVMVGTNTGQALVFDRNGTLDWETKVRGTVQVGILQNGSAYLVASQEDREKNKGTLRLFDADGEQQWFWNSGWITSLDFCQGTDRIVTGDRAGNVVMLDGGGFEVRRWNDLPKTYIIADMDMSTNGKYLAYALEENNPQVKFVTVSSGSRSTFKKDYTYTGTLGYLEPIRQIELSGDGAYLATAGGEGTHGVLNFYARNGTRLWSKDITKINDLTLDGSGERVFIAAGDGNISCYNRSGDLEWAYQSGAPVGSLSYARGSSLLAAGNDNGDLMVFDRDGTLTWEYELDVFPTGTVTRVEISSDGSALTVVADNRVLEYFVIVPEVIQVEETPTPEVKATGLGELTSPGTNTTELEETNQSPTVSEGTNISGEKMLSQVMTDAVPSEPGETQEGTFFGLFPFPWNITFPKFW